MKEQIAQEPLAGLSELLEPPIGTDRFTLAKGWIEGESSREVPVAVELGKRAKALATIEDYLAVDRRVRGSERAVQNPNSRFCQRYGAMALRVHQNAQRRHEKHTTEFREAIEVLAATDAMRANGQNEDDIYLARMQMQIEINKK